ncbi:D-alanyl-D-alanine carboxypeptidase [Pelagibacterium sp. 26DY04]|uniref:D-alanyl-D-alanine carboxypeptidase family protein n=1 Tax=unclassified Pelagibacterium TaxID=2623280 RepID=UPI002815A8DC|nr:MULTISPECIES: D-alanyl-D-alanine carboxypeptidase family protein [unclassified Pelagibacterium]WMT85197.1 D-alanyl-D-alanine carboxypeptidase [Pelagibacterium sp. 26DY04]WMT90520.1 D-alanyl-D-alanine carboxypeptidase [Pelagibacterium sp. H642]
MFGIAFFGALSGNANAQLDFDTSAPYAILVDQESGTVLYQKDADTPIEPASMAKLMTIAVVLDMVDRGALELTDQFFISEHAWRTGGAPSGGSTMFAELGSQISVDDLLHSVIIQSGNDAAIALAEGIAGSEASFAAIMNEFALDIGLEDSHFTNASGLPDPEMHVTARDLADLGRYIIREFPDYYPVFAVEEFTWNGITQSNRNGLLGLGIGVDGLKTGHTTAAGYGIVVSTTEGGRRLVGVLHGMESINERNEEARKLITWGARSFERIPAFAENAIVGYANVYGGETAQVGLVGEGSIDIYLPRGNRRCLSANIAYTAPILPPVEAGDRLAQLNILCDDQLIQTAPLYAAESVGEGDIVRKATDALWEMAFGWI